MKFDITGLSDYCEPEAWHSPFWLYFKKKGISNTCDSCLYYDRYEDAVVYENPKRKVIVYMSALEEFYIRHKNIFNDYF